MMVEYLPLLHVEKNKKVYGITFLLLVMIYFGLDNLVSLSLHDWSAAGYLVSSDSGNTDAPILSEISENRASKNRSNGTTNDTVKLADVNAVDSNVDQANSIKSHPNNNRNLSRKTEANVGRTSVTESERTIGRTDTHKNKPVKIKPNHGGTEVTASRPVESVADRPAISNSARTFFAEMSSIEKSPANIFFVESRCVTDKSKQAYDGGRSVVLNARQCCAVESTAKASPERPVYVFHSCGLSDDFVSISAPYVGRLMNYTNVYVVRLLPEEVFRGTPVQPLYERGALEASSYPLEHTSDLIRLALLWKFGGTYCDLDVVTIKPLSALGSNWAGMQDGVTVANGVLDVAPAGEAHDMLREALAEINDRYDPHGWSTNGPELLTRLLLTHCAANTVAEAMAHCRMKFTVYPSTFLYPLYYSQYADFFDERIGASLVTSLKGTAYSVHLWNKMSHASVAAVGSQQAYSLLALEFCPEVYASCGDHF